MWVCLPPAPKHRTCLILVLAGKDLFSPHSFLAHVLQLTLTTLGREEA